MDFNETHMNYECIVSEGTYCANNNNQTHVYMERPDDMLDPFHINPGNILQTKTHFSHKK
jgi:hypothetical protein